MTKTILITGCSSGIGHQAAKTLKARGYHVFTGVRKQSDLKKLAQDGFEPVLLDLDHSDSIKQGLTHVLEQTDGKLDALFNNAGFLQAGAVEDLTREIDIKQFQTNVFGSMELIRMVLPVMRQQGHGRIIQNSSILGIIALAYCGSYNASKFALEGYLNTLRLELRNTPIHVSLINPGAVTSKLRENAKSYFEDNLQTAHSSYKQAYDKLHENYFGSETKKDSFNLEAKDLMKPLLHALESKHPKAHYYPGAAAKMMTTLRRLLPDCLLDRVLASIRS